MSAPKEKFFDSKRASEAGKKSKRKPLDKQLYDMAQEMAAKSGITMHEAINRSVIKKALKDYRFANMYYDRVYGGIKQHIHATGELSLKDQAKEGMDKAKEGLDE